MDVLEVHREQSEMLAAEDTEKRKEKILRKESLPKLATVKTNRPNLRSKKDLGFS